MDNVRTEPGHLLDPGGLPGGNNVDTGRCPHGGGGGTNRNEPFGESDATIGGSGTETASGGDNTGEDGSKELHSISKVRGAG